MVIAIESETILIYYDCDKERILSGTATKNKEIYKMANTQNKQDKSDSGQNEPKTETGFGNTPSSSANAATPRVGESTTPTGGGLTGAATATARTFYDQAKETAGQAYEAVTDKAASKLDEQKTSLSGGLTTVADSVRQVSQNLGSSQTDSGLAETAAKYTDTAAKKIEEVATYFEGRNVREMARDLESFARRNPAVFFGAAFGLGLLAARFLKSSPTGFDKAGTGRALSASAGSDKQFTSSPSQGAGDNPKSEVNPL